MYDSVRGTLQHLRLRLRAPRAAGLKARECVYVRLPDRRRVLIPVGMAVMASQA